MFTRDDSMFTGRAFRMPIFTARRRNAGDALALWLASLSAGQSADYDPRKLDRMFTTAVGPTNVASNADPVGLLVDGAQLGGLTLTAFLAAAASIRPAGASTSFNAGAGTSSDDGTTINLAGTDASNRGRRYWTLTGLNVGEIYEVEFILATNTGPGSVNVDVFDTVSLGTTGSITPVTPGTYRFYYQATGTTRYLAFLTSGAGTTASFTNAGVKVRRIPGFPGRQSVTADRPAYQSAYLRGDGVSDNLLTTWLASAGANTVIMKVIVPASLAAVQILFGTMGASDGRLSIGVNTSGFLCGGVGADATSTILGSTDLRSSTVVVAITCDATTVKLFAYKAAVVTQEYSAAQNGNPNTSVAARLLALNNNGTPASFAVGDLGRTIAAQKVMSLAEFTSIAPLLAA